MPAEIKKGRLAFQLSDAGNQQDKIDFVCDGAYSSE
jgi:hypothetical protein